MMSGPLQAGDEVRTAETLRPRRLAGLKGHVVEVEFGTEDPHATVHLDELDEDFDLPVTVLELLPKT